jgi:hypothetical protein
MTWRRCLELGNTERKLAHRQAMGVRTLAFAKAGFEILPFLLGAKIWASVGRH